MNDTVQEQAVKAKRDQPEVRNVLMTDNRTVAFAGKRKMVKEVIIDGESVQVRLDFCNGETRTFDVGASSLLAQLAGHGASQKIGDETAGVTEVDDMVIAVDAIIERLNAGDWGVTRAAGDSFSGASTVIRAICESTGKPVEAVKAFLAKTLEADKAKGGSLTRKALYDSFRKPGSKTGIIVERLEKEKLSKASAVDADDLLAELN